MKKVGEFLRRDSGRVEHGHSAGPLLPDDADQVAHALTTGLDILIRWVQRVKDVGRAVMLEDLHGHLVLEALVANDFADPRNLICVEDHDITGPKQVEHGVAFDPVAEAALASPISGGTYSKVSARYGSAQADSPLAAMVPR